MARTEIKVIPEHHKKSAKAAIGDMIGESAEHMEKHAINVRSWDISQNVVDQRDKATALLETAHMKHLMESM